ncbi:condensation domain-containing protein [Streptomyces sp. NPDC098781]|uniref:condensation domain-containing protein n=1 Tax=Streptomyces sp. NPDC098781 TaxID=3366097 RepID=UPI003824E2E7
MPTRRAAGTAPLSSAQESLWFLRAADPEATTYHIPTLIQRPQGIDVGILRAALTAVAARHEMLRTTFPVRDGGPVQRIGDPGPIDVEVVDVRDRPDAESFVLRDARARSAAPFDLEDAPPIRCVVWQGPASGDAVLLCVHHIAIDQWSVAVLVEDLATAYDAVEAGTDVRLPEVPLQFADFAAWEREALDTDQARRTESERIADLRGYPSRLRLGAPPPGDAARSGPDSERGLLDLNFPDSVGELLPRRARELRVTPFLLALAAFQETVRRWSGQERFLIGTTLTQRTGAELDRTVGYFLNTVPLRCRVRASASFAELCAVVRQEFTKGMRCQATPFDRLVQGLSVSRAGRPLTQLAFSVLPTGPAEPAGAWRELPVPPPGKAAFDLTVLVATGSDRPTGVIEFDPAVYPRQTVAALHDDFTTVLSAALADPDVPVSRLPLAPRPGGGAQGTLIGPQLDLVTMVRSRLAATGKKGRG